VIALLLTGFESISSNIVRAVWLFWWKKVNLGGLDNFCAQVVDGGILKLEMNVVTWCMDKSIVAGSFPFWNSAGN